ncbi:MAG TPA: ribonuclease P protein component 4 [Thermoplasmata archaeon]|nr:ribonuclease P protein component 4 [Thermoplasmata archaeon]
MVRIAHERIDDLFALAAREFANGEPALADRYVVLARKVGTRYNVRLLPEYRELYCRACSAYWVEGRTVRTRLRAGRRVRSCLACGHERRTPLRRPARILDGPAPEARSSAPRDDGALVTTGGDDEEPGDETEEG